jgi:hypothetical protein
MTFRSLRWLPAAACALSAFLLVGPPAPRAFTTIGGTLSLSQRDVRVHRNFTGIHADDHAQPSTGFPGFVGAPLAVWKAAVEWGSELHGDGGGDPHQLGGLGSGGAEFDFAWQGLASGIGGPSDNVHSQIAASNQGLLAFTETPIADGWRVRYLSNWDWDDAPGGPIAGGIDLQGVATHELGHALGLGHSGDQQATMFPTLNGQGTDRRSIESDDRAGVLALYGPKSVAKPRVFGVIVNTGLGLALVAGTGFAPTGNEVWFTRRGTSAPAADPVVRVPGIPSDPSGTLLLVPLPSSAGPGDLLVRRPGAASGRLSNAWPIDTDHSGNSVPAPVIHTVLPPVVDAVSAGPGLVVLLGERFGSVIGVSVDGVPLGPGEFTVSNDTSLTFRMPLVSHLGPVQVRAATGVGVSPPALIHVRAPDPPVVDLEQTFLSSASDAVIRVGGTPGRFALLLASMLHQPSVVPSLVHFDIGGQFQQYWVLAQTVVPPRGWFEVAVPVSALPFATTIYTQVALVDPIAPVLPLPTSNVSFGTFF